VINTPWGELAVRDAHVHFFSHRFFTLLTAQGGLTLDHAAAKLGWEIPGPDPAALAARWDAELSRHGVTSAMLIASLPGDESSVAAAVSALPQRFHGGFMVNPMAPDAVDRTAAALASGLRCLCFFPAMHRYAMHDERAARLLDLAAQTPGAWVFVHCGVLSVGVRRRLGLPSAFDMRFSNPLDLHAPALAHPKLPFVVPHFGAGMFREALMLADLCPNVFLDTSSTNSWIRYEPPGATLASVFDRALRAAGPKRLLFGTDSSFYPRGWVAAVFAEQAQALSALGVTPEDAAAIFGGNLAALAA
jgi:hypothetical protein